MQHVYMIIFILIIAIVGTFIIPINEAISTNYNKNIVEAKNNIQNFIIYYGQINDKKIKELSKYSLVIIEPRNIKKSSYYFKKIRSKSFRVYICCGTE